MVDWNSSRFVVLAFGLSLRSIDVGWSAVAFFGREEGLDNRFIEYNIATSK